MTSSPSLDSFHHISAYLIGRHHFWSMTGCCCLLSGGLLLLSSMRNRCPNEALVGVSSRLGHDYQQTQTGGWDKRNMTSLGLSEIKCYRAGYSVFRTIFAALEEGRNHGLDCGQRMGAAHLEPTPTGKVPSPAAVRQWKGWHGSVKRHRLIIQLSRLPWRPGELDLLSRMGIISICIISPSDLV